MSSQPSPKDEHPANSYTNERYSAVSSDVYLYVSKNGEQVDTARLNLQSNFISTKKNRPILVINFNPHRSAIVTPNIIVEKK